MKLLKQIIKEIIQEKEIGNTIVFNTGGTRYEVNKNGQFRRLGSQAMSFGKYRLMGSETYYRRSGTPNIEIKLIDIFNDPNLFVGTFPVLKTDAGNLRPFYGENESSSKVLWAKFK
jgi:hypothetical protein